MAHGDGLEVAGSGLAGAGQFVTDESFSVAMRLPGSALSQTCRYISSWPASVSTATARTWEKSTAVTSQP